MCTRFGPPRVLRPSPLPLLLLLHPLPLFRPTVTTSHGPTTSELVQGRPDTPPLTATATTQHFIARHAMSSTWSAPVCAPPTSRHLVIFIAIMPAELLLRSFFVSLPCHA